MLVVGAFCLVQDVCRSVCVCRGGQVVSVGGGV